MCLRKNYSFCCLCFSGGLAAISSSGCTPLENWGKSPDENLLTYYQKGLEAYLADDYDTAMQNFSKASRYVSRAKDRYAVAQLYGKMAKLYTLLWTRLCRITVAL